MPEERKNKKILIIEDEKALQEVLRDRLEEAGYDIFEALTGEEGLRKYHENRPDIIILDIILPRTDGYTILDELRKENISNEVPIIVLTNLADDPNLQRIQAYLVDCDRCLVKSNTAMAEVISAVNQVLSC